ncbi:MAG: hypothetical protein JO081_11650 [Alphaproteobacteria bacterium]|nr:hypothetical protein [Alphaproteobacteria bacterium]
MTGNITICIGTVGSGAWTSGDGGDSWRRVGRGLGNESRIYGMSAHPREPHTVFAGADDGLYKSTDGGRSFEHIDTPMNKMDVWKIAFDQTDPDTIFAGTRPAALFRSRDGGRHWQQLPVDMVEECPNVGVPRVTALAVDPNDHRVIWAGVEVDGVRRSLDGGETWTRIAGGLNDPDIHDVAARPAGDGKTVLTSTPREIFASSDKGESWQGLGVGQHFSLPYCRGLALKVDDPDTVFVATGDGAAGTTGAIQRSRDGGKTWQRLPLPDAPNSPIWAFATHAADPGLIVACSHYGELYTTLNAGDSWRKLPREFTEIRALAWTPN